MNKRKRERQGWEGMPDVPDDPPKLPAVHTMTGQQMLDHIHAYHGPMQGLVRTIDAMTPGVVRALRKYHRSNSKRQYENGRQNHTHAIG